MRAVVLWIIATALVAGCGGGKKVNAAKPLEGWHGEEGWPGQCYHPPAFAQMGPGDRRIARQAVLETMISQWRGERGDGVSFDSGNITAFETVMFGEPTLIEEVALENLERCRTAMAAGGDTIVWARWLREAPGRLTEGYCRYAPLDYQLFDYLDIGHEWQIPAKVCQFDKVRIRTSSLDYYQIEKRGKWINAAGDPDRSTLGSDLPCNFEGCLAGMLLLRFTGDSGAQQIYPAGTEFFFEAPEHGTIEVQINDDTWFDNRFKIEGTIEHHSSIEYAGQ
ncbi:MAG: hypothetical protein JRI25_13965 [Deltaproteobacteria bacterium]|nr:hypothetical protein [Deltaproteobacteria bacterium]MBW2255690.1 hypothetical protein [Deltaproteobacteria bacterium]